MKKQLLIVGTGLAAISIATAGPAMAQNYYGHSYGEVMKGTSSGDVFKSYGGSDTIYGYDGYDDIYSGTGNDTVYAGYGADIVIASTGADHIWGGPGNDGIWITLSATTRDVVDCGSGDDFVVAEGSGLKPVLTGCESYDRR